ncbi:MAG TPA: hypothetical protein VL948_14380 [Verrucomicrobiae bacterium]|nr:hypothetical protein [Verrucomicrobiae bacterium]
MSRARLGIALALIVTAGGGCASWAARPAWVPVVSWEPRPTPTAAPPPAATASVPAPSPVPRAEPARLVERAGELAHDGRPVAARDLYERVVREYPGDPARAAALYGLGQLQCDPASPFRDYRAGYTTFGRLLAEHPRSTFEADARLWRATLSELLARDEEMARMRSQLQRLKRIEVELERSPR